MAFKVSKPSSSFSEHWKLWKRTKKDYTSPVAADLFYKRLLKADFLVLKNNFQVSTLSLYRGKTPVIMACHYLPKKSWPGPECLGAFALSSDVTNEEISEFWTYTKKWTDGRQIMAPLNGHHYLGVSIPDPHADPKKIGIFNASSSRSLQRLFDSKNQLSRYRTYLSFETEVDSQLKEKLVTESKKLPEGFRVRPFSKIYAKRDLKLFNQLVNLSFTEHFDFCPLTDEENYDIMKMMIPLISKGHFNFLEHQGIAIGFCMSMKDYHQIWDNKSDMKNIASFLLKGKSVQRARIIHIGIIPEFRGKKLTKQLRHHTLLNHIYEGVDTVENSYIDEENKSSIANVKSTNGKILNEFRTYSI